MEDIQKSRHFLNTELLPPPWQLKNKCAVVFFRSRIVAESLCVSSLLLH